MGAHATKDDRKSEIGRKNQPEATGGAKRLSINNVWVLFTGLAVGFAVARELPNRSGGGGSGEEHAAAPVAAAPAAAAPTPSAPAPAPARAPTGGGSVKLTVAGTAPRKGPKDAKVTVVEISDFQCPFCSRAVPTLKEIAEKYPKDVAVKFMHQPLSFHPNAQPAAIASMAAERQGKFWEMHDKLFANQQQLTPPDFERYAGELGLNMAKFKKDLEDPKIKEQVLADQTAANAAGANGTPTFFINGRKLVGAKPFAEFKTVIDEEIKKADDLVKSGTPLAKVSEKLTEQSLASGSEPPPPPEFVQMAVGDAPVKGPANAPVTIIEFSEFQCPFCSKVEPALKQIADEYKGKVRIAWKNLPLPFHNNAQTAAEAALAADEQGKFWPFHDKLMDNQQALDRPSLEKYAEEMKLDMKKFKAALDTRKFKERVEKDQQAANASKTTSTPSFFINGRRLTGAQPYDAFKRVIDEELRKSKT